MDVLYFLQEIRNPVMDFLVSIVTYLGDEVVFMAVAMVLFWCIDKYQGYYLLFVGFFGSVLNQFLKIVFRIPRPWVLDENFSIVEAARERAGGYSFPSGHTQSAVGTFGCLARWNRNRIFRAVCIAICLIVPFSRMYLGVHTPLDTGVSLIIGTVLVFACYPIVKKAQGNPKVLWIFMGALAVITGAALVFVHVYPFPADTDAANLLSAQENICKLFGSLLGVMLVYYLDNRYIHFETKATLPGQILKYVLGMVLVVAVKSGLKPVLELVFGDIIMRHALRYFLMVLAAGALWPMTFPWFAKLRFRRKY